MNSKINNVRLGSMSLGVLTRSPFLSYGLYFLSQLFTGLGFQEWLLNKAPFFTKFLIINKHDWVVPYLGFTITVPTISVAGWVLYMLITFLLEGYAADWFIKVLYLTNNYIRLSLLKRPLPADHMDVLEEVISVEGLLFKFVGCGIFVVIGDWYISSERALSGVTDPLMWWFLAFVYLVMVIAGEFLLRYKWAYDKTAEGVAPTPEEVTASPNVAAPAEIIPSASPKKVSRYLVNDDK